MITQVPGENIETAPPLETAQMLADVAVEYVIVPPSAVAARLKLPEFTVRDVIDPNVIELDAALTEIVMVLVTPDRYVAVSVG